MNFIKRILTDLVYITFCAIIAGVIVYYTNKNDLETQGGNYVQNIYRQRINLSYYGAKDALTDSIDKYIHEIAPNSCMNGLTFINECESDNIDLFFVLSQCQIESKFATTGLGAKTNSAFNVNTYEGKGDAYVDKYLHPDKSIKPYITILKDNYLVNGLTELNLLENFVNVKGNRYATDENYEYKLRSVYENLLTKYDSIYKEYKKYKLLSGN